MAKTKSQQRQSSSSDDDKVESLKSLNGMLLKETVERRQQVDSLTQINTCLESELNQCKSDTVSFKSELNVVTERALMLEIEKESVSRFYSVQLTEMANALEADKFTLSKERDEIRSQLEGRIRIQNVLLSDIQNKMAKVVGEKDLIEKESKIAIDNMAKEKTAMKDQRDLQERMKNQLQKSVDELEKKCVVSSDKGAKTSIEIDSLVKEKQEIEASLEKVTQEKTLVMKDLNEALKNLRNQNVAVDQLVKEIDDAKSRGEANIVKLNEQLKESNNSIATLEKSSSVQISKLKQLESEVSRYQAAFDQATKERNNAQASLDAEKLKVKNLSEKISKMDKEIEEMDKKVSTIQKDTEKHVAEKKKLEKARAALENDILVANKTLSKTQEEHDDTKGKLKVSEANVRRILKILKNTSLICNSKEDDNMGGINEETGSGEEIKHHVKEVEAIKKAFKDKESIVDEMKKQLELLKVSVAKADKGKSFWTMVSSATTIIAAVSLACVARGGY